MTTHSHDSPSAPQPQCERLITEKEGVALPIIVVGINRSGTTWLSNILSGHSQISAILSKDHFGVLETNLFNQLEVIGDITNPGNYVALIELWSATDYFKVSGIEKSLFYKLDPRPTQKADLFSILMRTFAAKENASFWLHKSSPIFADRILLNIPDCRVIIIRRNILDYLRSALTLRKKIGGYTSVILVTIFCVLQDKLLRKTLKDYNAISVCYEQLSENTEKEVRSICSALNIDFEESMLDLKFEKNTSFTTGKRGTFTFPIRLTVQVIAALTGLVPLSVLWWLRSKFRRQNPFFSRGDFHSICQEYDLD